MGGKSATWLFTPRGPSILVALHPPWRFHPRGPFGPVALPFLKSPWPFHLKFPIHANFWTEEIWIEILINCQWSPWPFHLKSSIHPNFWTEEI